MHVGTYEMSKLSLFSSQKCIIYYIFPYVYHHMFAFFFSPITNSTHLPILQPPPPSPPTQPHTQTHLGISGLVAVSCAKV